MIVGCTFIDNQYGGVYADTGADPTIVNCLFRGAPYGSGVTLESYAYATVANCTIVNNSAGGFSCDSSSISTATNCIIRDNTPSEIYGDTTTVTYCNVRGGYAGQGNIDADPGFVDAPNDDYRLGPGSPCIDAGNNEAVPFGIDLDLTGNPRFVDDPDTVDTGWGNAPLVDIGACEYQIMDTCPADVNDDETVDIDDLFQVLGAWGQCNDCPEDINEDGQVDIDDVFAVLSDWGPCT